MVHGLGCRWNLGQGQNEFANRHGQDVNPGEGIGRVYGTGIYKDPKVQFFRTQVNLDG